MVRPDKEELRRRAEIADERLRSVARRADSVRIIVQDELSRSLPIEKFDLYGSFPTKFHAILYFKTVEDAAKADANQAQRLTSSLIANALAQVDPGAAPPDVRIDIDSVERMETTGESYYAKFR